MPESTFILNTAKLVPCWGQDWQFFEIDVPEWNDKYFNKIVQFRRSHEHTDFILESSGRRLIGIPKKEKKIDWVKERKIWEETLSNTLSEDVSITSIANPFATNHIPDDDLLPIREALGGLIAIRLKDMGFEKVSSKGSVGRFYHPKHSGKRALENGNVILRHLWEFTVNLDETQDRVGKDAFLSIDLKTEVSGQETMLDLIRHRSGDTEVKHWPGDQRRWNPCKAILEKYPNVVKDLRLMALEPTNEGLSKPLGLIRHGPYKDASVRQFVDKENIKLERDDLVAVLKDKSRSTKDPNAEYRLPTSLLEHIITNSSVKNRKWEHEFHRFSKFPVQVRREKIRSMFELLSKNNMVESPTTFIGSTPDIAYPTVRSNQANEFGRKVNISDHGVHEWGSLSNVNIYHESRFKQQASTLYRELGSQLARIAQKTGATRPKVEVIETSFSAQSLQRFADKRSDVPWDTIHLFIGYREDQYRTAKTLFTHQNRKPVQFIQPRNIRNNVAPLVRTLIPQLIAKTGGLPYRLSPPLLDRALVIGLDKARDSSSTRPSASAGVAAVTPEGRYISGASTPLDSSKHDRIDVDALAPQLLQCLSDQKDKLDYVVILRDGAPATCRAEVESWKRYLAEQGLDLVFFASRKQNPYRIFPVSGDTVRGRIMYTLPVILNGPPLAATDFLVITTNPPNGTARPVLYTLMENTANISMKDIKERVIAQVVSMALLCWESPFPTSQPLPLHYADKLAAFTQMTQQAWIPSIEYPMFI